MNIIEVKNLNVKYNEHIALKNINMTVKEKEYILLLGDLIDDISMVSKNDLYRTLTIGFLENKVEENMQFYNDNFDIVFTNNTSFEEVQKLIFMN